MYWVMLGSGAYDSFPSKDEAAEFAKDLQGRFPFQSVWVEWDGEDDDEEDED